ncbi:hypothetical protein ABT009_39845 [Streptomyces sp. NPDC002896]|uniref:hypothetical protein n=1 Tax=Streptomyces sp. NPDC002896 TaxID=3154438 RepID=UPI00331DD5A3
MVSVLVAVTALLPLTGASAGPVHEDATGGSGPVPAAEAARTAAETEAAAAARCGPELSSPEGIEAQTRVLTQGRHTWARTYYRNVNGREASSVLSLMVPDGQTVQMHCTVTVGDEPGACETPRGRTTGDAAAYAAVAEFAATSAASGSPEAGPLLLRSGSDQPA